MQYFTRDLRLKNGFILYPGKPGGTSDDTTALSRFWNNLIAAPGAVGVLPDGVYTTTAVLPTVSVPGFTLIGAGLDLRHTTGATTPRNGTIIKYTGSTSGSPVLAKFEPTSGASEDALIGLNIIGVTFNANNLAAKAITIKSCRYSNFEIGFWDGTTSGCELDVLTNANSGDPTSLNMNRFVMVGVQDTAASGVSLRLKGDADGNPSFNWFERVDIFHTNAVGISCENCDNNLWGDVRIYCAGSATNTIEWLGNNTSDSYTAREETFLTLSANKAAIAKGTGTYTYPAHDIQIYRLDSGNNTPLPTEETGATIYHPYWRTYSTTITSGTGSFTTATATMVYRRWCKQMMEVNGAITITTNGTAASFIRLTIPYTANANSGGSSMVMGKGTTGTAVTIAGVAAGATSQIDFQDYAGVYPGADGYVFQYHGTIRLATTAD